MGDFDELSSETHFLSSQMRQCSSRRIGYRFIL